MSVGGVVGAIISVTTVIVVIAIAVALVIARKRKPKKCGTCDLKATVSVDKYSMQILVHWMCGCVCVCVLCTYVHEHSELYVLDLWGNV